VDADSSFLFMSESSDSENCCLAWVIVVGLCVALRLAQDDIWVGCRLIVQCANTSYRIEILNLVQDDGMMVLCCW